MPRVCNVCYYYNVIKLTSTYLEDGQYNSRKKGQNINQTFGDDIFSLYSWEKNTK
jgi:hypothetical protein